MKLERLELYGHPFVERATLTQDFRTPSVMRDDACFIYVHKGTQEIYASVQKFVLSDHEAILLKCGNYITNFRNVSPVANFQSMVFHLDPEAIRKAFGNRDIDFLRINKKDVPEDTALKYTRSELLDNFMKNMWFYFEHPELATESLLAVKLQELVLILCESGDNEMANKIIGTLYTPSEIAFDKVIESNLYNNLSIGEIATLANCSESTFKRKFKTYYKESPARYFRLKKLEKAAQMLRTTDIPVSSIAWDCGFENPAHFSTCFVQQYGQSPKAYRNDPN